MQDKLISAKRLWDAFSADMQHFTKGGIPEYIIDWIYNEISECPAVKEE